MAPVKEKEKDMYIIYLMNTDKGKDEVSTSNSFSICKTFLTQLKNHSSSLSSFSSDCVGPPSPPGGGGPPCP